jgi:hypothetical protein
MDGVDQHHSGNFVLIQIGEDPDEEATHGVADHHEGWLDMRLKKDRVQSLRSDCSCFGGRIRPAPAKTASVVGYNLCEFGYLMLNPDPGRRHPAESRLQDHRRSTLSRYLNVHVTVTNIQQPAWWWVLAQITSRSESLINTANPGSTDESSSE